MERRNNNGFLKKRCGVEKQEVYLSEKEDLEAVLHESSLQVNGKRTGRWDGKILKLEKLSKDYFDQLSPTQLNLIEA